MSLPYLYEHQNPHAPRQSNGRRFHGRPLRIGRPRLIGLHDTESLPDLVADDAGAENVARYQSTTPRPSSYHRITDSDTTVVTLPDEAVAYGIANLNSPTLHVSLAMQTVTWESTDPETIRRRELCLERTAVVVAEWCEEYGIPVRFLSRADAFGSSWGIVEHGVADPDRRSDPGRYFPRARFLSRVHDLMHGAPTIVPAPAPSPIIPATEGPLGMLLIQEPHGSRVFRVENGTATHIGPAERDAYLEAGAPMLKSAPTMPPEVLARRAAVLERAGVKL